MNTARIMIRHFFVSVDGASKKNLSSFTSTLLEETKRVQIEGVSSGQVRLFRNEHGCGICRYPKDIPEKKIANLLVLNVDN